MSEWIGWWQLHKSIKFLSLLHEGAINYRSIHWLLPARKQRQPYIQRKPRQLHRKEHGLLFIAIADIPNSNEAYRYKCHVDETDSS